MVSVANAWSDQYENAWWQGYDQTVMTARQSYDANRTYTYALPGKEGGFNSEPLALNTSKYDEAVNEINTHLGAYGDQMPTAAKAALKAIYDAAIATEKAVMLDWHTQVYNENPGIANRYPNVKTAWDAALANDAAKLEAQLSLAKALTEAQILIDEVASTPDKNFWGKASSTGGQWTEINGYLEALTNKITTYSALDLADVTDYTEAVASVAEGITNVKNALAKNEELCKESDQQLLNLKEAIKQVEAVLAANPAILSDESKTDLQAAYDAVKTGLAAIVTAADGLRYDKIGTDADTHYDNDLLTWTAKLNAALAKAINGSNADMFIAGLTWTYGQPLPIVEPKAAAEAYELNWENAENGNYNAALTALNGVSDDIPNLKSAATSISSDYATKKGNVNTEWGTVAFNDAQTTYTKPNQWKYNKDAWDSAIALDAQDMNYMVKLASAIVELNTTYDGKKLEDAAILGAYATQYADAKAAVQALLGKDEAAFKEMLLNADYETLDNINKVRANFLAVINAINEEKADVNTANELLTAAIDQAKDVHGKLDENIAAQAAAKQQLGTAIETAEGVQAKVTGEKFNELQNAQDVTAAFKTLSAALTTALNGYNAAAPTPNVIDPTWVYDTPEFKGEKGNYALVWTEYDKNLDALKAFIANASESEAKSNASTAAGVYDSKEGSAKNQWNSIDAWTNVADDAKYAHNWSYNQLTWQAGINEDAAKIAQILSMLKQLDALQKNVQNAEDPYLKAADVLSEYATPLANAIAAAKAVINDKKAFDKLTTKDSQDVMEAGVKLQAVLDANAEEIEDVQAAAEILRGNIATAEGLKEKGYINESELANLQAKIGAAQAVLDLVDAKNFETIENAKTVTEQYTALSAYMAQAMQDIHLNHAPETAPAGGWTYSEPLSIGTASATAQVLDWAKYDEAMTTVKNYQNTTTDAALNGLLAPIVTAYEGKQEKVKEQFDWVGAWPSSDYKSANNYEYNKDMWDLQILQDANYLSELGVAAQDIQNLYEAIQAATTLTNSTAILGAYKAALDAAIQEGQNAHDAAIASINETNALYTAQQVKMAIANLQAVVDANTEETQDVKAADALLAKAIEDAKRAKETVEDVDGGTAYQTNIQTAIDAATTLYDLAEDDKFTDAATPVVDAQTITDAIYTLNEAVAAQVLAYAGNITNVTTVDWVYAQPLRLGDNQDPKDAANAYELDWTDYEAAQAELQAATFTAPEVQAAQTAIDGALTSRETLAQTQWTSEPAWTGTNDKFANQFQYNQTQWQNGIAEDAKNIRKATMILTVLEKMYLLNTKADALYNSKKMLQAPYLKDGLKDAYDASKALYDALTGDHSLITETSVAQCEAALVTLQAAYDAVDEEEYKSVKTAQPLLNDAIKEAKVVVETVEDVEAGTYKTNIQNAIAEAEKLLAQAQNDDFDGDADGNYVIKFAKTLTDAVRTLNNAVRQNVQNYTAGINNIAPTGEDWAYATPLRLGEEKDPAAQDANGNTKYTLDWTKYDEALKELKNYGSNLQDADFKAGAYTDVVNAYTDKETKAKNQWTSVPAWEGTNDKFVNQYQYNQTTWQTGINQDVEQLQKFTAMTRALNELYKTMKDAEANYIPAADNKNVLKSVASTMQKRYDNAVNIYGKTNTLKRTTLYDIQAVVSAEANLTEIINYNNEEAKDVYTHAPDLKKSIDLVEGTLAKIKDDAETKWYDALKTAKTDAETIYNNAGQELYNNFKSARDITVANYKLVMAMVEQTAGYQDSISALKDTLQKVIDDAREASLVVNVNNTYSTDLQNELAAAYAMMSGDAMLPFTANEDLNITKLQTEITKLKRVYCSAFILDLDSLKAAIADVEKFITGITPYNSIKGIETVLTTVSDKLVNVKERLAKYEEINARQTSAADPYKPYFTDAAKFNEYNTVTLPAYVDKVNQSHMKYNLQALKAVADSIQSFVNNEKVVTLYQNSLAQVIDHANSIYAQYNAGIDDRTVFNNFENQDKISDAIVTAYADFQKFYAANDAAIQEAEAVRAKLVTKIADATTLKGELTDATSQNNLQTAITTATTLKDTDSASPEELTNGITALDLAMKTARWTDDIARLNQAINEKELEATKLTDEDAMEIMNFYINQAKAMLASLQTSVNTTVTTAQVSEMITILDKGLIQANTYNNGEMMPDMLGKARKYSDLISDEIAAAEAAHDKSATLPPSAVKAAFDALAAAVAQAEGYTKAKTQLETAIAEAKLAEVPTAAQQTALAKAETAVAKAFTKNQDDLTAICNEMDAAYNELKTAMNDDRWSHQALTGKLAVPAWKPNAPNPGHAQYLKLAGKYTSADAGVANNAVDLFVTNYDKTSGTFDWAPFSAETHYKANIINLSSTGVSDFNNWTDYGWSYDEHYNDIIIKAGAIYSTGDGFVNANHTYGPFTWTNVWNQNDLDILDKDADGYYYGRYYTFKWSETNKGGVYRVASKLSIYDETEDQYKDGNKEIEIYISHPTVDGDYFINADNLELEGGKGYDNKATVFDYKNGTAILNGRWHRIQFIDKDQYDYHQAAQKAADWYNNNPDLRHYDTAALKELAAAVESNNNKWNTDAIEAAMEKVLNSYGKVNMILGDSLYGVIADGAYADVQRTYTVTGAPGDKIDALIIAQTKDWTKDDSQYWTIISNGDIIGADSTATITVKFNPGTAYPADYREYQAILDVKVGNLNYQDEGKENLQQNLYGANPKLSLKENELLQAHSLNLHRKDSITYDLYGRGYAHLYEKSPLKAKFYSATGLELATSEVKTTFVKSEFTAYGETVDQTKFTVSYYPEDLGVDVVKVVISDTIRQADDIVLMVNAAKSEITFDPATVYDANQNKISVSKKADGTDSYFFPADGETYYFPIAISNFDGVNANTEVVNEDGEISIVTEKIAADGLVEEHLEHKVQITINDRDYFDVTTATTQINGTNTNVFVIAVKTDKLEPGTDDDGQHDGLLQIIWQDQDTIKINLNQTLPWFDDPESNVAPTDPQLVDVVTDGTIWRFTEEGDKIWYVDVKDVDNYYEFATNFKATTNTDWFLVNPSITYKLTDEPGTRRYRLQIIYNPHEVNTVYQDVLTLSIYDTSRNVVIATTSIKLYGDAVSSIKGGAGFTGVNNAEVESSKKDGKYIKDGKIVIVKGGQEYNASGAQLK